MNEPEFKYGWICPRCGASNAPTNKICVTCMKEKNGHVLPENQSEEKDVSPTLLIE